MITFKSKCGKYDITVDNEDYQRISDFAPNGWEIKYTTGTNYPYAITRKTINGKRKQFYLHRVVLGIHNKPTPHVDHINGKNKLDNRKSNLRIVTRSQNMKNRSSKKNSRCKYLGVSYCLSKVGAKKYRVNIQEPNIKKGNMHLGYYLDDESAGYAYNIAAEILHKEYANFNDVDITKVTSPELIKEDVTERLNKYLN